MRIRRTWNRRWASFALALLLTLTLLLTVGFMYMETGHACLGDQCNICHQIRVLSALLQQMAIVALALACARRIGIPGRNGQDSLAKRFRAQTPVALRTRMNN